MAVDEETLAQFVETVRRYTREKLVPLEDRVALDDSVPEEVIRDFRDMGLFGFTTPEEYGGLGLGLSAELAILGEMCWASVVFRNIIGLSLGLGSQSIAREGTPEQKDHWLPRIASGETITSFCLTEPHSGSDAGALTTSAVRDGDGYVLNGTKRYITNAPIAGLFIVMARTTPERLPRNAHVSAFLVPADTPGVRIGAKERKMGQQGSSLSDVIFEDARVPASALLGGVEGRGFVAAMKSLDRGRISVAGVAVGQARRILHEAATYAAERTQFGEPIGNFQLIQAMLADSFADLYAGECMVRDVARRYDAGEKVSIEASAAKMFCSEMVGRIADRAVQIHGGAGYMRDSAVEHFYRDVRVLRIFEGTTQIQQTIIGKELVKRAAAGSAEVGRG